MRTGWTASVGDGLWIRFSPPPLPTNPSSLANTLFNNRVYSARHEHRPNASYSSGLFCMTDAGQRPRERDMVCETDDSCALCAQDTETIHHLLAQCPFSRDLWFNLLRRIGWGAVSPLVQDCWLVVWWTSARKRIQKEDRPCFDSLVIMVVVEEKEQQNFRS